MYPAEAARIVRLRSFVRAAPWRFAKTMAQWPHEYTVRGGTPRRDFEHFVRAIREQGYQARFKGRLHTYLDLDGYKYWTMGAPVESTQIINRTELDG